MNNIRLACGHVISTAHSPFKFNNHVSSMNEKISVLIIEDSADYRSTVELAMESETDFDLIGQFGTSEIAIQALSENRFGRMPKIILLDLRLPGMDGLEAMAIIQRYSAGSKIIVLTQSNQEQDVLRAVACGASGYLMKSATLSELMYGIRMVASGGVILDASVAQFILNKVQTQIPPNEQSSLLSERETEVLTLIAEGFVKKQIAKKLGIGYTTVDTHVSRIYVKLRVSNAPAAVNIAHRLNLFPPSSDPS